MSVIPPIPRKSCFQPVQVRHEKTLYYFSCGKCPRCVTRKKNEWSFRIMQEQKRAKTAYFVTLTYNSEHVPISRNGYMTLNFNHVQDFIKRLRYYNDKMGIEDKITYYQVGEYGSAKGRPHFHILLFNASPEAMEKAWRFGHIHLGNHGVTEASAGYLLKYMGKTKKTTHARDDRQGEKRTQSQGIGKGYINAATIAWHAADLANRVYCPAIEDRKYPMARYYKERIYDADQRAIIQYHYLQKIQAEQDTLSDWHGGCLERMAEIEKIYHDVEVYSWERMWKQTKEMYKNDIN